MSTQNLAFGEGWSEDDIRRRASDLYIIIPHKIGEVGFADKINSLCYRHMVRVDCLDLDFSVLRPSVGSEVVSTESWIDGDGGAGD